MRIVQISDLHAVPEGTLAQGVADTNALLAQAVTTIRALRPIPDLVLVTGDLTDDDGTPAAYDAVRTRLAELPVPCRLLVGNHDDRDALRAAFPDHDYLPPEGALHYAFDLGPLRVVVLDTKADGGGPVGELGPERLAWTDRALAEAGDRPVLLAMHHQPAPAGLLHLDRVGLRDGEALAAIVARHPAVRLVIAGHVHRPIAMAWAGSLVMTAPAVGYQFPLTFEEGGQSGFLMEPPGFLLHLWRPEGRFVTHRVYSGDHGPGHAFRRKPGG